MEDLKKISSFIQQILKACYVQEERTSHPHLYCYTHH